MINKETFYKLIPFKDHLGARLTDHFMEKPIFLVGSGRSGTTALALALNQQPHIDFSVNEAALSMPLAEMVGNYISGPNHEWHKANMTLGEDELRFYSRKLLFESVWGSHFGLRL